LQWAGSDVDAFVQGDATDVRTSLSERFPFPFSGVVLDPPYGRNSHGSMDHSDLLQKTLTSAADVTRGGLVLILPSEPRPDCLERALTQDDRPALKHYSWQELEGILESTSWTYQQAWYIAVHGSLGRVLIFATNAPQD
jgi:tRNA G10  N-methylase Trm11